MNQIFFDKSGLAIKEKDILVSDIGKAYLVVKDKQFGLSIKDVVSDTVEKLYPDMMTNLELMLL